MPLKTLLELVHPVPLATPTFAPLPGNRRAARGVLAAVPVPLAALVRALAIQAGAGATAAVVPTIRALAIQVGARVLAVVAAMVRA